MPITLDGSNGITTPTYGGADTSEYLVPVTQFKNRIINGAMVIDQRNAGASVTPTNGQYLVDRWFVFAGAASKFTAQQSTTATVGFINSQLITSSSAYTAASTERFGLAQCIEGLNISDLAWGTANAKTVTLSFWVRSSLTGTFSGALSNSAGDRGYAFTYTISSANTYEYKTVTIAGDTTGTWLTTNGIGILLNFNLGSGSNFLVSANAWSASPSNRVLGATSTTSVVGTNGATFYITGVQLEVGSTATSFDYRPYGTELALCQRYFQKNICNTGGSNSTPISGTGVAYSTTAAYIPVIFLQTMRATPTLDRSGCRLYEPISGGGNVSAMALLAASNISTLLDTTASSLTSGRAYWVSPVTASTDYVSFSAEL